MLFDAIKCVSSCFKFVFSCKVAILMICCPVAQQVPLSLAAKPPRTDGSETVKVCQRSSLELTRAHWRPAFSECFGLGRAGCALSILEVLRTAMTATQSFFETEDQFKSIQKQRQLQLCSPTLDLQSVGLFRFLFCLLTLFRFECFFCLFGLEALGDNNL